MEKTDLSIHKICIAAIKRKTIKPYDFKWTTFYEDNIDVSRIYQGLLLDIKEGEIVICSTLIDSDNFSFVTTRKILTKENGILNIGDLQGAKDKSYGDFKGYIREPFTFGRLLLSNGTDLKYFIETGRASMVMIYGVSTALTLS